MIRFDVDTHSVNISDQSTNNKSVTQVFCLFHFVSFFALPLEIKNKQTKKCNTFNLCPNNRPRTIDDDPIKFAELKQFWSFMEAHP